MTLLIIATLKLVVLVNLSEWIETGGVCIYVKSTLYAERCFEYEDNLLECVCLKIRSINKTLYFACVYRPPNSDFEFWQTLSECVGKVKDDNNPNIFIVGDLKSDVSCNRSKIHDFIMTNNLKSYRNLLEYHPTLFSMLF